MTSSSVCSVAKTARGWVWLRIGNSTNRVLFAWLEPLWPEVVRQLEQGQRVIEVRRD